MQRLFCLILIVLCFISCSDENYNTEKRICILKSHVDHEKNGFLVGTQAADTVFFCKGFWKIFVNKFPITSSKIFGSNSPYQWGTITVGDTALEEKVFDSSKILSLRIHLPMHISGLESIDSGYQNKLIVNEKYQNDTNLMKNDKLKYRIRKDYADLIQLLNDTTVNEIRIYCTKSFLGSDLFKH
jgi:hypothetical protein